MAGQRLIVALQLLEHRPAIVVTFGIIRHLGQQPAINLRRRRKITLLMLAQRQRIRLGNAQPSRLPANDGLGPGRRLVLARGQKIHYPKQSAGFRLTVRPPCPPAHATRPDVTGAGVHSVILYISIMLNIRV